MMRWAGPNTNIAIAICASTVLAGCASPLGRVRHQKPEDLTKRLDPDYKPLLVEENQVLYTYEVKTDVLGRAEIKTPPVEKIAGHLLKEYVTRAYFEEEWPYRVWKFGNDISDWIDEQLQFDFYGFKGDITARTNEIGITFTTEF